MKTKRSLGALVIALAALTVFGSPRSAAAFDMTGGRAWEARRGPGLSFSLGIQGCTQDFCDDYLETGASIGGTVGFYYRIISNVVVFADFHIGHIPSDIDANFSYASGTLLRGDVDNDDVMSLNLTVGAEFHLPVAEWVAPYFGFGIGYAYLGLWGEIDRPVDDRQFHAGLQGVDFQLRFGADFFPFRKVASLSIGPALLVNLPAWVTGCWDIEDGDDDCEEVDDLIDDRNDRPFVIYFGVMGRYGF